MTGMKGAKGSTTPKDGGRPVAFPTPSGISYLPVGHGAKLSGTTAPDSQGWGSVARLQQATSTDPHGCGECRRPSGMASADRQGRHPPFVPEHSPSRTCAVGACPSQPFPRPGRLPKLAPVRPETDSVGPSTGKCRLACQTTKAVAASRAAAAVCPAGVAAGRQQNREFACTCWAI